MQIKKWLSAGAFLGMALFAFSLNAEVAVPSVAVAGFANGHLNFIFSKDDAHNAYTFELQMKDEGSADYATIYSSQVSKMQDVKFGGKNFRPVNIETNFVGEANLRARFVSGDAFGEWVEIEPLAAYERVSGVQIGNTTENGGDTLKAKAFDGNFLSMVDDAASPWLGYDFGSSIRIARIRFHMRHDNTRGIGAAIQYASTPAFDDAVTVHTTTADNLNRARMNDVVFDTPISARCVRIVSSTSGRSSVCEFEVVPYDIEYYPSIAVEKSDVTNFYPVITWSVPKQLKATTIAIERATSEAGPWTKIADCNLAEDVSFVDDSAKVGVLYYYRGETDCTNPSISNEPVSEPLAYRRLRRLDRSWDDESTLFDGITILPLTNGADAVTSPLLKRPFDGDVKTYSDWGTSATGWGPVGLNFGENVFVGGFGYVCRLDNATVAKRITTAKMCASVDVDDIERVNKTVHSDFPTGYSTDPIFFYEPTTSMPTDGAPCWFLYGFGNTYSAFCLNVAELAFFGWTAQDIIDAKILSPATGFTCRHSDDKLAVELSWMPGANMTGYRIERRVRGAEGWTTVATLPASALSASDSSVTTGFWDYRIVTIGADAEELPSLSVPFAYYAPGTGTGLVGAIYAPYAATTAALTAPRHVADIQAGAVNIDVASGAEIIAGSGVTDKARLLWGGQIVIPLAGTYVFRLETTGGGAVHISGQSVCNAWVAGTSSPNGEIELEPGTYQIEVDARLETAVGGRHRCVLYWGGVVADEPVPATQLIPGAQARTLEFEGWDLRQFGGTKLGRAAKTDAGFTLSGPPELTVGPDALNTAALTKPARESFDLSALVTTVTAGRGGIMARAADGKSIAIVLAYADDGSADVRAIYAATEVGSAGETRPIARDFRVQPLEAGTSSIYVRLKYDCKTTTFTAYWRADDSADWTQLWTSSSVDFMTGKLEVGYFSTGLTLRDQSRFAFSDCSVSIQQPGLMLIIR